MRGSELKVGKLYAFPTNPGPWYRYAVRARVMTHGRRDRVLVMFPDGVPASPTRDEIPCAALVWVEGDALLCTWEEWPSYAAESRIDLTALVSSAVAAIGGDDAPRLVGGGATAEPDRWWSRPVGTLLRPPARGYEKA
ncbi:MAG: hypothetical protein LCI03_11820 [Actinobacteria bacterium]|jgi:hypothetical protein|nr:hypothetical protein [Actinomycetota bacterium]